MDQLGDVCGGQLGLVLEQPCTEAGETSLEQAVAKTGPRKRTAREPQVSSLQISLFDDSSDEAEVDVQSADAPQTEPELETSQGTEPETQPETEVSTAGATSPDADATAESSLPASGAELLDESSPDQRRVAEALARTLALGAVAAARKRVT